VCRVVSFLSNCHGSVSDRTIPYEFGIEQSDTPLPTFFVFLPEGAFTIPGDVVFLPATHTHGPKGPFPRRTLPGGSLGFAVLRRARGISVDRGRRLDVPLALYSRPFTRPVRSPVVVVVTLSRGRVVFIPSFACFVTITECRDRRSRWRRRIFVHYD
jgi:hypothetical protein